MSRIHYFERLGLSRFFKLSVLLAAPIEGAWKDPLSIQKHETEKEERV
jgi:hypothetical protein